MGSSTPFGHTHSGTAIRDRRRVYEKTGDPLHLAYEHKTLAEIRKHGRQNPEIKRNYYLEDMVEEGNFISRDRLTSCARPAGTVVPTDPLFVGVDWARSSDHTWMTICNGRNDVVEWFKYPHAPYTQQVELMNLDLDRKHAGTRAGKDGKPEEYEWTYRERVLAVRGDDTGPGGPMEILQNGSGLPVGEESFFKFSLQNKDTLYTNFEQALFKDPGEPNRFSYPADHPLTAEFEEQMTKLVREYKGGGEYL